jgi:hypothetical protein
MSRAIDDEIVPAFFGAARTGENGSAATPFDAANPPNDDQFDNKSHFIQR